LVWTGRLSYGLYLWHYPIFNIGQNYFPPQKYGLLALVPLAILTLGAATISYYFIERPFLRLKNRIGKGKTSTTDTTPATLAAQSEQ
jgi:peptidoglycan/LPS O-acetylase OafA/YrhL